MEKADTTALIPFFNLWKGILDFPINKVVIDSGDESEENYGYLYSNGCPYKKECIKVTTKIQGDKTGNHLFSLKKRA